MTPREVARMTPRQRRLRNRKILRALAQGYSVVSVGLAFNLSTRTVYGIGRLITSRAHGADDFVWRRLRRRPGVRVRINTAPGLLVVAGGQE